MVLPVAPALFLGQSYHAYPPHFPGIWLAHGTYSPPPHRSASRQHFSKPPCPPSFFFSLSIMLMSRSDCTKKVVSEKLYHARQKKKKECRAIGESYRRREGSAGSLTLTKTERNNATPQVAQSNFISTFSAFAFSSPRANIGYHWLT